jgi:hypothetical protein
MAVLELGVERLGVRRSGENGSTRCGESLWSWGAFYRLWEAVLGRGGEAASRVVMAAVVHFQSGDQLWEGRRRVWRWVMRGNEGYQMPVQFSYSRAEENGSQRRRARQRQLGRWWLGCCQRKGMTPGLAGWAEMGRELG